VSDWGRICSEGEYTCEIFTRAAAKRYLGLTVHAGNQFGVLVAPDDSERTLVSVRDLSLLRELFETCKPRKTPEVFAIADEDCSAVLKLLDELRPVTLQ
jgi:hypothetical protein